MPSKHNYLCLPSTLRLFICFFLSEQRNSLTYCWIFFSFSHIVHICLSKSWLHFGDVNVTIACFEATFYKIYELNYFMVRKFKSFQISFNVINQHVAQKLWKCFSHSLFINWYNLWLILMDRAILLQIIYCTGVKALSDWTFCLLEIAFIKFFLSLKFKENVFLGLVATYK